MRKQYSIGFTLISLFISMNVFGQSKHNLSKQLWERVQNCYSQFEDKDGDGKLDKVEIIDDAENGFLKVSGAIGTCGCHCNKAIAAFKDKSGNYTFLEQETSDCSWLHKVSSSRNLVDILPENFGIQSFIPNLKDTLSKEALFYLDFNIPQHGTATEVSLKIIPIGMHMESDNLLVYRISEDDATAHVQELNVIPELLTTLSSKSMNLILNNQLDKLCKQDIDLINTKLKKNNKELTIDSFGQQLRILKKKYNLYVSIEHKSILLKWDKEKAKFYIYKKGDAVKPITFKAFLINKNILKYWMAIC